MVKYKLVRNLLNQPLTLLPKNRHGEPLVVPSKARRFPVGPSHYETSQFKNLLMPRRGNPAFLVVIGEENVPEGTPKPVQAKAPPKAELTGEERELNDIRNSESIETSDSFFGGGRKGGSSKKKTASKGDAAGAASAKSENP